MLPGPRRQRRHAAPHRRPAEAQQAYQELASGNAEDPWVKSAIAALALRCSDQLVRSRSNQEVPT